MDTLVSYLPILACGAMMLICIPMMRNMHKGDDDSADADAREEIAELREETACLRAHKVIDSQEEELHG